jgi:hypothetical protein
MKYFAEYYVNGLSGEPAPMCGSDGCMPLDGRLRFSNMVDIARQRVSQIMRGKYVVGFYICKGDYRNFKRLKYISVN